MIEKTQVVIQSVLDKNELIMDIANHCPAWYNLFTPYECPKNPNDRDCSQCWKQALDNLISFTVEFNYKSYTVKE